MADPGGRKDARWDGTGRLSKTTRGKGAAIVWLAQSPEWLAGTIAAYDMPARVQMVPFFGTIGIFPGKFVPLSREITLLPENARYILFPA